MRAQLVASMASAGIGRSSLAADPSSTAIQNRLAELDRVANAAEKREIARQMGEKRATMPVQFSDNLGIGISFIPGIVVPYIPPAPTKASLEGRRSMVNS